MRLTTHCGLVVSPASTNRCHAHAADHTYRRGPDHPRGYPVQDHGDSEAGCLDSPAHVHARPPPAAQANYGACSDSFQKITASHLYGRAPARPTSNRTIRRQYGLQAPIVPTMALACPGGNASLVARPGALQ